MKKYVLQETATPPPMKCQIIIIIIIVIIIIIIIFYYYYYYYYYYYCLNFIQLKLVSSIQLMKVKHRDCILIWTVVYNFQKQF